MPLSINVGLSRKASENYQSLATSINITAELDGALLSRPDDLQRAIANLYVQARTALDRQAGTPAAIAATPRHDPPGNGHNARPVARFTSGNGNGNGPKPMSDKQRSAILAIAKRADVDAFATAKQTFGVDLDQLTGWQASQLIDSLKAGGPA